MNILMDLNVPAWMGFTWYLAYVAHVDMIKYMILRQWYAGQDVKLINNSKETSVNVNGIGLELMAYVNLNVVNSKHLMV